MSEVPNPGSAAAQALGCTCPIIDNHYGRGFMMGGERVWWHTARCPVHDPNGDQAHALGDRTELLKLPPAATSEGERT